jgi:hypothetical protein
MSVEIETIGLDIDGTKIILDKGAAKELYFKLKELFGGNEYPTYIPYPVHMYPPNPIYPWVAISSGTTCTTTAAMPNTTYNVNALTVQ